VLKDGRELPKQDGTLTLLNVTKQGECIASYDPSDLNRPCFMSGNMNTQEDWRRLGRYGVIFSPSLLGHSLVSTVWRLVRGHFFTVIAWRRS